MCEWRPVFGRAFRPFSSPNTWVMLVASAALDPRARECQFTVMPIEPDIAVFADPEMLSSAIGNLLQNAGV